MQINRAASLVQGTAVLAGGAAVGQAIALLLIPATTRAFDPSSYGVYAVFLAATLFGGYASTLRYHLEIPIARDDEAADDMVALSMHLACAVGMVVTGAAISLLCISRAEVLSQAALLLLGPSILLAGVFQTASSTALRHGRHALLSAARCAATAGLAAGPLLAAAFVADDLPALVVGHVSAQALSVFILVPVWRWPRRPYSQLLQVARQHSRYATFSTPAVVLNSASVMLVPVVFLAAFGPAAAGFFSLCQRIVMAPIGLFGQAYGQLFYVAASKLKGRELEASATSALGLTAALAGPAAVGVYVLGSLVQQGLLGGEWAAAGVYLKLMAPWTLVALTHSVLSFVPMLVRRQDVELISQIALTALRGAAIYVGFLIGGPVAAVAMFVLASLLGLGIFARWASAALGVTGRQSLRSMIVSLFTGAPVAAAWLLAGALFEALAARVLATCLLGAALCIVVYRRRTHSTK